MNISFIIYPSSAATSTYKTPNLHTTKTDTFQTLLHYYINLTPLLFLKYKLETVLPIFLSTRFSSLSNQPFHTPTKLPFPSPCEAENPSRRKRKANIVFRGHIRISSLASHPNNTIKLAGSRFSHFSFIRPLLGPKFRVFLGGDLKPP